MAEKQTVQPLPQEKRLTATVVSNYGDHRPGATIEVDEREYMRLREPALDDEGEQRGWTHPVLITKADQEKLDEQRKKDDAKRVRDREESDVEARPAWAELEQKALERLRSAHRSEQARQISDVLQAGVERS